MVWVVAGETTAGSGLKLPGLTHALTSFVGRSAAMDKVAALLAQYRMVTITGPGGVGKTRLADEVLKRVAGRFADGACVVELAGVQDPELVPAAVATALGLRQTADIQVTEALTARLSRQQLLVVLDNCEHVLDSVAKVCAAVLLAADDIRILATSREPLGLPEEARYRLSPMTAAAGRDNGAEGEAETLFAERARQFSPDFVLDDSSRPVVSRLVERLDGMPLAIELAAARVEALGLAQLLERLDDRFRLLVSTNRVASARQRSLEAAVDWSYQLLGGPEQRAFRLLSVFPGAFTLDAAEAVAGTDAGPAVMRLVDCSLLAPPQAGPDGRSRYSMLETLRSYGTGRLRQAGEDLQAAGALAAHELRVAERASALMTIHDQEQAAALWLDAEDAAAHQGLSWLLDHDPHAALRLAVALAPWWLVRGRWVEGYALLRRAVTQTDSAAGKWHAAQLWLGELARLAFDHHLALGHFVTVVDALTGRPPSPELVDGLAGRCSVLRNMGRLGEASADARTALELARQVRYLAGEAVVLQELSLVALYGDRSDEAVDWARQAQRVPDSQIPGWRARKVRSILPWALVMSGQLDGADDYCAQDLAQARAAGDLAAQSDALYMLSVLAGRTGRLAAAGAHLREAAGVALHAGHTLRLLDILDDCGYLCAATSRHAEAITLWAALAAQNEAAGLPDTEEGARRREAPLRKAEQALGDRLEGAQDRGAAMTLAAAVEFAVMMAEQVEVGSPAPDTTASSDPGLLSVRERELVALVAQGRTDAEIAGKLYITVATVRTHLDRIRDKSGCRRRADLTRLALEEGII